MFSARYDRNAYVRSARRVGTRLARGAGAVLILLHLPLTQTRGQDIVELARRRHSHPDTALIDYRSRLNTLVSAGLIVDRLAPPQLLVASELASAVSWQRERGLQIRMLGQRYVTSFGRDAEAGLDFSQPWFVATAPGDSLRVLGSIELPTRAAVHPFAQGADRYYRYELGDTVTLLTPTGQVELVEVKAVPIRGDEALVVGSLWVAAETGDVGAMQIRFVGKPLWADEDDPEGSTWANRILAVSATLEHGLWESRFWLPHHQELELMVHIPFISEVAVPIVFRNEFGRYDVNTGEPIAWLSPDSARTPRPAGGEEHTEREPDARLTITIGSEDEPEDSARARTTVTAGPWEGGWEIIRPPDDSLLAYDEWDQPLETPASRITLPSAAELERRARQLAPEIAGRKTFAIQYDRLPELIRYNRVEALGLGLSARWDIPRRAFWSVGGSVGFGLADLEPKGRLGLRYDPPGARIDLSAYSELHLASSTLTDERRAYGNALRALFLGRDDADYYRASGAALTLGKRWGRLRGRVGVGYEDHRSVDRNTQVALPRIWEDSIFRPNPQAVEGGFWRGDVGGTLYLGEWTRPTDRAELTLGFEVGAGPGSIEYVQPRAALRGRVDLGGLISIALAADAGWTGGEVPPQREWRIGGLQTLRGYEYAVGQGDSFWAGRIEAAYKRGAIAPVVFADFAWAGDTEEWPGDDPTWSVGAGVSLLWGALRADLAFPESGDPMFELYLAGML
ncbi:MAG: hypothetical protein JSV41_06465 [Gemmatimonadota bacterium]|nr:MAG: hypothetical protein JSV41_06465 [Gemmatimonadota bacterium]